jgi:hypothetical protein
MSIYSRAKQLHEPGRSDVGDYRTDVAFRAQSKQLQGTSILQGHRDSNHTPLANKLPQEGQETMGWTFIKKLTYGALEAFAD